MILAFELSPTLQTLLATFVMAVVCFLLHLAQRSAWIKRHETLQSGLDMILEGLDRHKYGDEVLAEGRTVAKEKGLEHVFDAVVQSPKPPTAN